jgi:hypothetical protein
MEMRVEMRDMDKNKEMRNSARRYNTICRGGIRMTGLVGRNI